MPTEHSHREGGALGSVGKGKRGRGKEGFKGSMCASVGVGLEGRMGTHRLHQFSLGMSNLSPNKILSSINFKDVIVSFK